LTPAIRAIARSALTLTLLVSGVLTDHQDRAVAADDLALFAHRLYGSSNLHCSGLVSNTGLPHVPGVGRQAQTGPNGPTGKDSRGQTWTSCAAYVDDLRRQDGDGAAMDICPSPRRTPRDLAARWLCLVGPR
jgi:hypothetical protein